MFVAQLETLAAKNKADVRPKFLAVEAETKTRLIDISSRLQIISETQPNISSETEGSNVSKNFLRVQQKQLLDLQRHFDNYVDTLPVFGFNSGKYDLYLIKAYLVPRLLNDRTIQPTVIKKASQFIFFKFGDIQFLDILNFLGGAASLDSFLKAYQSEETIVTSHMNGLIRPQNLTAIVFHPTFFLQQTEKSNSFGEGLLSVQEIDGIWERGIRCSPETGFEREAFSWKRELCSP